MDKGVVGIDRRGFLGQCAYVQTEKITYSANVFTLRATKMYGPLGYNI